MEALLRRSTLAWTAAMACCRIMKPVCIPYLQANLAHDLTSTLQRCQKSWVQYSGFSATHGGDHVIVLYITVMYEVTCIGAM